MTGTGKKNSTAGRDSTKRCPWCGNDPLYQKYHDEEWGVPCFDEAKLFEFIILEGAQAGLSWITILKKRDNYRRAFDQFDPQKMARYTEHKIQSLKIDAGIVRNELKIRAAVNNARCYLELCEREGSLANYLWAFVDGTPIQNQWRSLKQIPAHTPLSDAISKDMKQRGFKFFGSTICYAHMQATGMVNDHLASCERRVACAKLAAG
ncbi:MAG: DNA-3-methyladenine glycosylase I, partial [Pseudomonadales bacterium]|nr:DNA-3-methyladenine glycosylase I [Pseudomonadales bacterium]